jgi:uncharacterized protein
MRILFSMLFGAGAVLLTERIEKQSGIRRSASIFYRRNLWLLAFGLFHGIVLWFGDILVDYSVLALVFLYPIRNASVRTLIAFGLLVSIPGGIFGGFQGWHILDRMKAGKQLDPAQQAGASATPEQRNLLDSAAKKHRNASVAMAETLRQGRLGFVDGWSYRRSQWISLITYKFESFRILEWFGAMIIGMGLYKSGYLANKRRVREYVLVASVGYAIAFPIVLVGLWQAYRACFTEAAVAKWLLIPYSLQVDAGALGNLSVLLLFIRYKSTASLCRPLAAVGRTAFSNYLLTTLACQFLFAWGPWRLYGKLEFYQWYLVVAAVWTLNLTFSVFWLRYYVMGPLEWFWRSLTYWKLQPLRIKPV